MYDNGGVEKDNSRLRHKSMIKTTKNLKSQKKRERKTISRVSKFLAAALRLQWLP